MLGVTFSQDLTWNKQVDNINKKADKRVYMLYQLKCAGYTQNDVDTVYVNVLTPFLIYVCPVWYNDYVKRRTAASVYEKFIYYFESIGECQSEQG